MAGGVRWAFPLSGTRRTPAETRRDNPHGAPTERIHRDLFLGRIATRPRGSTA